MKLKLEKKRKMNEDDVESWRGIWPSWTNGGVVVVLVIEVL